MQNDLKGYDVVVIGSGAGRNVVDATLRRGLHFLQKGRFPADRIVEMQEAGRMGEEKEFAAGDQGTRAVADSRNGLTGGQEPTRGRKSGNGTPGI